MTIRDLWRYCINAYEVRIKILKGKTDVVEEWKYTIDNLADTDIQKLVGKPYDKKLYELFYTEISYFHFIDDDKVVINI